MKHTVTLLDGATGTELWRMAAACGVERVPVWQYNLTHPELVEELARRYVRAGSGMILANTFCANEPAVARCPGFCAAEVVAAGVRLARRAAGQETQVALSVAPLDTLPADAAARRAAATVYDAQMAAGVDAGADCIVLETFWDLPLLVLAAERARSFGVPVLCSLTFGADGCTPTGATPVDAVRALEPLRPAAVGLNCSGGAAETLPLLRRFHGCTDLPLLFKPNALPGQSSEAFAKAMAPAAELAAYIGGCCGTSPEEIAALRALVME